MAGTASGGPDSPQDDKPRQRSDRPRIVIADSDPLARRVVREALQEQHGFIIPGEASNGIEAVELCRYYRPDAALLEYDLGHGLDGIAATERIRAEAPEVAVLMFSREESEEVQLAALSAGAAGFVPKSAGFDEVAEGLRLVIEGKAAIPPHTTMVLIQRLRVLPRGGSGMRPVRSPLTQREWEILDLLTQSLDTRAIARTLVLSEETVYSHVKNILRKLGVHSRREAIEITRKMRDPLSRGEGEDPGQGERRGPIGQGDA